MDLSTYNLEDLLLAAIKSEVESRKVYSTMANIVRNVFLKDRLLFLAEEEKKHKKFVEAVYKRNFPGREVTLPEDTPVPLPHIVIPDEYIPLSEVFESAMEAELASSDFYKGLGQKFSDSSTQRTLLYFAAMEMNHYKILEAEQETMKRFEDFDTEWPMMNVGP